MIVGVALEPLLRLASLMSVAQIALRSMQGALLILYKYAAGRSQTLTVSQSLPNFCPNLDSALTKRLSSIQHILHVKRGLQGTQADETYDYSCLLVQAEHTQRFR